MVVAVVGCYKCICNWECTPVHVTRLRCGLWAPKPGLLLGKNFHLSPCFVWLSKPFCLSSLGGEAGDTASSWPDVGVWCHWDRTHPQLYGYDSALP